MQMASGVLDRMDEVGRKVVRDHMIEQHQLFFSRLPFVVIGSVDGNGDAWATIRTGRPGFLSVHDDRHLDVRLVPDANDPATVGLADGQGIGMLGIELNTRRRNRLNGVVRQLEADHIRVEVDQSFGNCPQYIQLRHSSFVTDPETISVALPIQQSQISGAAAELVLRADTFFVASYMMDEQDRRRVDVSHRGGRPGFVRLDADGCLTIPDFSGNLFFNTLGNFLVNPKAGLVFVDFSTGATLQITGDAEVVLESPDLQAFEGAERLWRFCPRKIVYRPAALPMRWDAVGDLSPNSLLTGDWKKAAAARAATEKSREWRKFRISTVKEESDLVRSLELEPADGFGLVPFQAGQHISIRIALPGDEISTVRNYSLSVAPSDGRYRVSIKREGRFSRFLHDTVPGAVLEVRGPAGHFTLANAQERPLVLVAAGIGITPILSMLKHIVNEKARTRRLRETSFFYAAKSKSQRAFDNEISTLVGLADGHVKLVRYLGSSEGAKAEDYDRLGRVDAKSIMAELSDREHDFYICGPTGFMQAIYDGLLDEGVSDGSIHLEAFEGPGVTRQNAAAGSLICEPLAIEPVTVRFARSNKTAIWTPKSGSLLDLAESSGLQPDFQCRQGSCGTCQVRLESGSVAFLSRPAIGADDGNVLICCAAPRLYEKEVVLSL